MGVGGASLAFGLLVGVLLRPSAPGEREAREPSSPPSGAAPAPSPRTAAAPPGDWADSLPLPEHVADPGVPDGGLSRRYQRVGQAAPTSRARTRTVDFDSFRPVLVQRVAGDELAAFDVGLGPAEADIGAGVWARPGACGERVRLSDGWPSVQGREVGRMGEWIFALVVPVHACETASVRAYDSRPSAAERREIIYAVQSDIVLRRAGVPRFEDGNLRSLIVRGDVAWGVFRADLNTTQIYPPPPRPQLAFVAEKGPGGDWVVQWYRAADTGAETLALAGLYDVDGNGGPEAIFGVRSASGGGTVLVVDKDQGRWRSIVERGLGHIIRE